MIKIIPDKDYKFMQSFFADEPAIWDEIRGDVKKLRLWGKTIKSADWYDVDDTNTYEYFMEIGAEKQMNIFRNKI